MDHRTLLRVVPPLQAGRRTLVLAAALGTVRLAWAQARDRQVRIAILSGGTPDAGTQRDMIDPFVQGLRALGYIDGRNAVLDWRWADGRPERLPALLAELLRPEPDVLVAIGPRPAELAKNLGPVVPVVALAVNNPVLDGLAASLARPGGHITGISSFGAEVVSKRLQLFKDLVPAARRVAVLSNPVTVPDRQAITRLLADHEKPLGMEIRLYEASAVAEFDAVFDAMARDRMDGVLVLGDATFYAERVRLGALCRQGRLPSIWGHKSYLADSGGLASYQSDFSEIFLRAPALVDKILKGAKPGDIPFERATKLDLVINLKAARDMGITVPRSLLVSADEVIP
jgi:putative tryptophan/tyrosine transport system substrate-binding protein